MTNAPKPLRVSVVIPVFNEERLIKHCLQALTEQTIKPYEVLIVDNNSTDSTVELAKSFDRVKVVTENRQGISYARSTGYNTARGDIIARIDADTIVKPNWIESIIREFNDSSLDALAGSAGLAELSPPGLIVARWYYRLFRIWHEHSLKIGPVMYGYNCAFRKKTWQQVRQSTAQDDELVSEDLDITLAFLSNNRHVKYTPGVTAKCHALRSIKLEKLSRYYYTDGLTLKRYQMGNPKRWAK